MRLYHLCKVELAFQLAQPYRVPLQVLDSPPDKGVDSLDHMLPCFSPTSHLIEKCATFLLHALLLGVRLKPPPLLHKRNACADRKHLKLVLAIALCAFAVNERLLATVVHNAWIVP